MDPNITFCHVGKLSSFEQIWDLGLLIYCRNILNTTGNDQTCFKIVAGYSKIKDLDTLESARTAIAKCWISNIDTLKLWNYEALNLCNVESLEFWNLD